MKIYYKYKLSETELEPEIVGTKAPLGYTTLPWSVEYIHFLSGQRGQLFSKETISYTL